MCRAHTHLFYYFFQKRNTLLIIKYFLYQAKAQYPILYLFLSTSTRKKYKNKNSPFLSSLSLLFVSLPLHSPPRSCCSRRDPNPSSPAAHYPRVPRSPLLLPASHCPVLDLIRRIRSSGRTRGSISFLPGQDSVRRGCPRRDFAGRLARPCRICSGSRGRDRSVVGWSCERNQNPIFSPSHLLPQLAGISADCDSQAPGFTPASFAVGVVMPFTSRFVSVVCVKI